MADLPGPKIRVGQLAEDQIELKRDDAFTLTTNEIIGDRQLELGIGILVLSSIWKG
jgi:pyruvate kinase